MHLPIVVLIPLIVVAYFAAFKLNKHIWPRLSRFYDWLIHLGA